MSSDKIIADFLQSFGAAGANGGGFSGMTLGVVVDTDDPLQMGRLRVFCPTLNDDPKQVQYVPWSIYASPFSGSINNSSYTRGSDPEHDTSDGATHYGFWAIPELGAHVLVGCIDGDYRRRFWFASVPSHMETNTLHGGRYVWADESVDGPLTSSGKPLEPLYTNSKLAFNYGISSPEWKSRMVDYQVAAIRDDFGQVPNTKKNTYTDQTNKTIIDNEPQEWVHEALGAHGYDWTGFKNLGAFLSSRTYGMSSPGMQTFVMDDRPFNSRIKLRTTSGHQIIMDDTNERIYIATNKGNNWIELDSDGNIDMYSETRISVHAAKDLNLTANDSIRIWGKKSVNIYAGEANYPVSNDPDSKSPLAPPALGTVSIEAESDLRMVSTNSRAYTHENTYIESGLNYYGKHGDSATITAIKDISSSTINGDHMVTSGNNIFTTSKVLTKCFSEGTMSHSSDGDYEAQSFNGASSVSASQGVRVKSANANVDVEAGMSSGEGKVSLFAPGSQQSVGNDGVTTVSSKNVTTVSGNEVTSAVQPGLDMNNANALSTVLASANVNISKISTTDISINSALGDIKQKTIERGHSFNKMGDQIDLLTANLNTLTMQTGYLYQAAQTAIGALGGSISLDFSFDISCALNKLYSLLPQELLNRFATYEELKRQLERLGHVVENLQAALELLTHVDILAALGLPNININLSLGTSSCTGVMPKLSDIIKYDVPQLAVPEKLRELIHGIFDAGSQLGERPPLTTLSTEKSYPNTV